MNDGKGIALLALILALISLGLGGYVFYDIILTAQEPQDTLEESDVRDIVDESIENSTLVNRSQINISLTNQWYKDYFEYSFDGTSDEYVDPMSIVIDLNESSTLYVLFNAYVRFPTDNSLFVNLRIDNTEVGQEMRVKAENVNVVERYSLALQYYDPSLILGSYNVSVWARVGATPANLYEMSLYIEANS